MVFEYFFLLRLDCVTVQAKNIVFNMTSWAAVLVPLNKGTLAVLLKHFELTTYEICLKIFPDTVNFGVVQNTFLNRASKSN